MFFQISLLSSSLYQPFYVGCLLGNKLAVWERSRSRKDSQQDIETNNFLRFIFTVLVRIQPACVCGEDTVKRLPAALVAA